MCVVQYFLGVPCPGCGLLRCIWALFHGEWERAFILFPIWPLFILFVLFRKQSLAGPIFMICLMGQWFYKVMTHSY